MVAMPRPRRPHLHVERSRHGKVMWYVRVGHGPRHRIKAAFGTPEFDAEYTAALNGDTAPKTGAKAASGTLAWGVGLYRQSSAWRDLSPATRRMRENILIKILAKAGHLPLSAINRGSIIAGRESRSDTPAAARHFVETLRGFYAWATDVEIAKVDPTQGVKVPRKSAEGFPAWTDEDCAAYEARWPLGTRERVAYAVLRYTGLRRGDATVIGRPHIRDGVARLATEKTGERVAIVLPDALMEAIAAGPTGDLTFIAGENGRPMKKESFGNWFREACSAAGVTKSAHGLRKLAATADAEAGWTESELEAKYGWRGGRMASKYTRTMDRERLSLSATERTKARMSIPSPSAGGSGKLAKNKGKSDA